MDRQQIDNLSEGLRHINTLIISNDERDMYQACIELGAVTQWVNNVAEMMDIKEEEKARQAEEAIA